MAAFLKYFFYGLIDVIETEFTQYFAKKSKIRTVFK